MSEAGNPDPQDDGSDSIYRAPESKTAFVPQDDALAAYVGPKNAEYYAKHFEKFRQGGSISWNWPAFFLSTVWLLYRKLWLLAFLYWFVLPISLSIISGAISTAGDPATGVLFYYGAYVLIGFVLLPMYANRGVL